MKYLIVIFSVFSGPCQAQTFAELQSDFEQARLEAKNNKLSKIEVYSFKNQRDSIILSYRIFDSIGNIINARQYNYKQQKYYQEQFYNYDSLGRRVAYIRQDQHLDKIKRGKVTSIEKYSYKGDSLTKRSLEYYFRDSLIEIRDIPSREREKAEYTKKVLDTSGRIIRGEYFSVAGFEKVELSYYDNGEIQSQTNTVDDKMWWIIQFNELGDEIEYTEWLYSSNSSEPIVHTRTYYDDNQMIVRKDFLNQKGKVKSFHKYYYWKY